MYKIFCDRCGESTEKIFDPAYTVVMRGKPYDLCRHCLVDLRNFFMKHKPEVFKLSPGAAVGGGE